MINVKRCCVYKLKEGKKLNKIQEMFSEYVYVDDFARNPLDPEELYAVYRYIDINTLDYGNQILGLDILPYKIFEEYFDFYWETKEINEKVVELMAKEKSK